MNITSLLRKPDAWLPLLMSLAAIGLLFGYVAWYGWPSATDEPGSADEGLAAHAFQLLLLLQIPVVGWFAVRRLPDEPVPALVVLALQGLAILVAIAAVIVLES